MCKKDEDSINHSKNLDDLQIDLKVMQKNISSNADKMPLNTKFRRLSGFFRKLIRSALIIQESFNAATYRVIKQLTQKVEDLSNQNQRLEEEIKQLKATKDKSDDK